MFITKKRYIEDLEYIRKDINNLSDKYWKLYHKHERLMKHLNLLEYEKSGFDIVSLKDNYVSNT